MNDDKLIKGIAETMRLIAPASMFKMSFKHPENRRTFFEIVCNKACLNSKSLDVMRAFEVAMKGNGGKN